MTTGTFPSSTVVEKDRFGTSWPAGGRVVDVWLMAVLGNVPLVFDFLVSLVEIESWRSCAQGCSVGSAKGGTRLHQVSQCSR